MRTWGLTSFGRRIYTFSHSFRKAGRTRRIADTLTLSISTIVCYRGRLLDRLQLTTTGELIAYPRAHALTARPMVVIKRGRIGFDRAQAPRSELMRGMAGARETNGDKG